MKLLETKTYILLKKRVEPATTVMSPLKQIQSALAVIRTGNPQAMSYRRAKEFLKAEYRYIKPERTIYKLVHKKTGVGVLFDNLSKFTDNYYKLRQKVRKDRSVKRNINIFSRSKTLSVLGFSYVCRFVGGVHVKSGTFKEMAELLRFERITQPKSPESKQKRYIGIEFEFTSPLQTRDLKKALIEANVDKVCELKTDHSLRPKPGEVGYELAILLPEKSYSRTLKKICDILNDVANAQTEGRRCGLHVHLDVRKRNRDLVYNNLVLCQDLLFKMVAPNRRNGEFCHRVKQTKFPTTFTGSREERYYSINAAAYYKFGTLEVRMHEGSTEFADINNWIKLLVKIANHRSKLTRPILSVNTIKNKLKLKPKAITHIYDRINKWQVRRNEEVTLEPLAIEREVATLAPIGIERIEHV